MRRFATPTDERLQQSVCKTTLTGRTALDRERYENAGVMEIWMASADGPRDRVGLRPRDSAIRLLAARQMGLP